MSVIPVYAVNLPEDRERLRRLLDQLDPAYFGPNASVGFLGRMLPDSVCLRLTHDPNSINNKGALGVMMSHILIWEKVARQKAGFALVLEDDVRLHYPEKILTADLPATFDFIFCNDSLAGDGPPADQDAQLICVPAVEALPFMERRQLAVGAYGYLITPSGAAKLLSLFSQHLYFGHVDLRMMAYACRLDDLEAMGDIGSVTQEIKTIRRLIEDRPLLSSYVMTPALVEHIGMESRRAREDSFGKTENLPNPDERLRP